MTLIDDPRDSKALDLLQEIVICLIDEIQNVTIKTHIREGKVFFGVCVSPRDLGFLIGKHGQMADAIRTVMKGIGQQSRRRYLVYFESIASSVSPASTLSDTFLRESRLGEKL